MPKDFIDKFYNLRRNIRSIAEEFEELYTGVYGYHFNDGIYEEMIFNSINKIYDIKVNKDNIIVSLEVECQDLYEDYSNDYDTCVSLPPDFFSNHNEYLLDINKKKQENLEAKKLKDIEKLKKEIADKTEKLYNLTENVYCGDIQTLLEDI